MRKHAAALLLLLLCFVALGACSRTESSYQPRRNVVVFLYHTFLEGSDVPEQNAHITTNAVKFEEDILTLLELGYLPISLNDMYENRNDKDKKYFALTFDDGYLTNYEVAYPILQKHGCYADIFINTDNEYMEHHFSFEQAKTMESSGLVTVHSHFTLHKDVREYSDGDFANELMRSFTTLDEHISERRHRFFAYPYGYYTEQTCDIARNNGIRLQFIQEPITTDGVAADMIIRTSIGYDTDIAQILETAYMN